MAWYDDTLCRSSVMFTPRRKITSKSDQSWCHGTSLGWSASTWLEEYHVLRRYDSCYEKESSIFLFLFKTESHPPLLRKTTVIYRHFVKLYCGPHKVSCNDWLFLWGIFFLSYIVTQLDALSVKAGLIHAVIDRRMHVVLRHSFSIDQQLFNENRWLSTFWKKIFLGNTILFNSERFHIIIIHSIFSDQIFICTLCIFVQCYLITCHQKVHHEWLMPCMIEMQPYGTAGMSSSSTIAKFSLYFREDPIAYRRFWQCWQETSLKIFKDKWTHKIHVHGHKC